MTKYTLTIANLSSNGFKDPVVFYDLEFSKAIEIMEMFQKNYSYVCEYNLTKFLEIDFGSDGF